MSLNDVATLCIGDLRRRITLALREPFEPIADDFDNLALHAVLAANRLRPSSSYHC